MDSSFSKVDAIEESIWSGARDRSDVLKGGAVLAVGVFCFDGVDGVWCTGSGGGRCFTAML